MKTFTNYCLAFGLLFATTNLLHSQNGPFHRHIVALVDPTSTVDDVHNYLRQARVEATNDTDRMLLNEAARAIYLDGEATRLGKSNLAAISEMESDPYYFSKPFFDELNRVAGHKPVPSQIRKLDSLRQQALDDRMKNFTRIRALIKEQEICSEESLRLLDQIRSDIGATGKGSQVANMAPTFPTLVLLQTLTDNVQKVPERFMKHMESDVIDGKVPERSEMSASIKAVMQENIRVIDEQIWMREQLQAKFIANKIRAQPLQ